MGTPYVAKRLRQHFYVKALPPIYGIGHHHAHAAAFFVSPFDDAATSVYTGSGNKLQRRWHTNIFNSLGVLYSVVTQHLGFKANQITPVACRPSMPKRTLVTTA